LFGKVLGKSNESDGIPKRDSPSPTELSKNASRHRSSKTSSKNGGTSSASGSDQDCKDGPGSEDLKNRNKKTVTFSQESPVPSVPSDSSSPAQVVVSVSKKQSKVSAREERSRRRQAIIHKEAQLSGVKRVRPHTHNKSSSKKARVHEVIDDEEEVIKVPMKTGTLYLYRGIRRRVEFVRKI
jgi:hypothetical protein